MIEVELKCGLFPELLPKLREKLQRMTFDGIAHNVDRYYDTPRFDLLRQAVFVRVRNDHQLEFKFNEKGENAHLQTWTSSSLLSLLSLPLPPKSAHRDFATVPLRSLN